MAVAAADREWHRYQQTSCREDTDETDEKETEDEDSESTQLHRAISSRRWPTSGRTVAPRAFLVLALSLRPSGVTHLGGTPASAYPS